MNQQSLNTLLEYIQFILTNKPIPEDLRTPMDSDLAPLQDALFTLSDTLCEFNSFAHNICIGNLDAPLPSRTNLLAGNLKELHSVLKHLTWQTKQVSDGDYSQRISFLGEFSTAFNTMIEQLQEREYLLLEQSKIHEQSMEVLMAIIDAHMDWIFVTDKYTNQLIYNNQAKSESLTSFQRNRDKIFHSPAMGNHLKQTIKNNKLTNLIYYYRPTKTYYSINSYPMNWKNTAAIVHYISDITSSQLEKEALSQIAYLDELTGSYNRRYCTQMMHNFKARKTPFSLVMADLNDLKIANDQFGHTVGDEYICTVVDIFKRHTRNFDIICRIGGDEFILLLHNCPEHAAQMKMQEISAEIDSIHRDYRLSISYGITYVDTWDWISPDEIIRTADTKMYAFKHSFKLNQLQESESMLSIQHLYTNLENFQQIIAPLNQEKECLVQLFTTDLNEQDAVLLAQTIQSLLPEAIILGCSACDVIYEGTHEKGTLITIEQYRNAKICAGIQSYANQSPLEVNALLRANYETDIPNMIRILFGGHYGDTYDFLECFNMTFPDVAIAGGLVSDSAVTEQIAFVFDTKGFYEQAFTYCSVIGPKIQFLSKVNTSTELISSAYTINETNGTDILLIENEPACQWFEQNLGFNATTVYKDFDDISKNDPLVRFQLILENQNGSNRVLCYSPERNQISQYYSKLPSDIKFRIGYASPSKCVEECKNICLEIQQQPVEFLFAYSCLIRKLYLHNCSSWELAPFGSHVSGVYLLGEFGYTNDTCQLYNGSTVLCGIAEGHSHLPLEMNVFDSLDQIQNEHEDLLDFIHSKREKAISDEASKLFTSMIHQEEHNQEYLSLDSNLDLYNVVQYERDNANKHFTKLCMLKVINAELLIGYLGRTNYYCQLKLLLNSLIKDYLEANNLQYCISTYVVHYDTIIFASNNTLDSSDFLRCMSEFEAHFKSIQYDLEIQPFIARFVMVSDQENLLDAAYNQLQLHYSTQDHFIIGDTSTDIHTIVQKEVQIIHTINYAIKNKKVIPFYQGIYNNNLKCIDKYESLMRLEDEKGNILPPIAFLGIAKKYRLYLTLTKLMVKQVLKDFQDSDFAVAINISSLDIESKEIRNFIKECISTFSHPERLVFEILEDECFKDTNKLKEFVKEIKSFGSKVAIDDFGSGYSNLLELIKIRPDYIKIDGQIIKDIHNNFSNELIITTISSLSNKMEVQLVAEFVENIDIQHEVERHGITYSQGYFFSVPQPMHLIPTK